jgi:hypothetical protein
MWTVKYSYYHPTEDALLLLYIGPQHPTAFQDPNYQMEYAYYRTPDRHYAEVFLSFESNAAYKSWLQDHPELEEGIAEVLAYLEKVGVTRKRFEPPVEDYDWGADPAVSNAGYGLDLGHEITFAQIFE